MSRITDILVRVRDSLADPDGDRWSDARLLRLVSEAQQDIAKFTRMLKAQTNIQLELGVSTYALPSDCWLITRASYNGCAIGLVTHEQLDAMVRKQATASRRTSEYNDRDKDYDYLDVCWEDRTGSTIEALIYDKRNLQEIVVYPIPNEQAFQNLEEGVVSEVEEQDAGFGVLEELGGYNVTDTYGVADAVWGSLNIWYVKTTEDLVTVEDELTVPAMWDVAIKHYVVAHAFDDDYDTRFAEKSAKALSLYNRELGVASEFENKNNVKSGHRTVQYRTPFD